jgi:hypothetical protein
MECCYYCGNKKTSREHLPPQQIFRGFKVDCMTVPSCDKHNTKKTGDDEAIVKSMLMALEKGDVSLNDDVKLALEIVKQHFHQVKRKASERTLYKHKDKDYNFIILSPEVDLSDWIRKLSAGLIYYKTKFFDCNNQFANSIVFERNSYHNHETPKDLSFYEEEYNRKMELVRLLENVDWINGWNDTKNIYPETLYAFYYSFIGEKSIIIKHIFYQQFTHVNLIELSDETLINLKKKLI